jgi:hypothetical protein
MKLKYFFLAALLTTACSFSKDNIQHETLRLPQERISPLDTDMYQNHSLKRKIEVEKKRQKTNIRFEYPDSYTRLPERQPDQQTGGKTKSSPKKPTVVKTEKRSVQKEISLIESQQESTLSSEPDTPITSDELANKTEVEVIVTEKSDSAEKATEETQTEEAQKTGCWCRLGKACESCLENAENK